MIDDYEYMGADYYDDRRDKFVILKGDICQESIEVGSVKNDNVYNRGIHIGGPRFG